MVPGILFDEISAPQSYELSVRVSAVHMRKETRGHATFSLPFTTSFPPFFFFFNLYKVMGCYICLILNLKQSHNLELKKPVLIFG